jgi:hypothetical protein
MYVEITGRQTGKTSRLVEDMVTFLTENGDKTALLVSFSNTSRSQIKKKVMDLCGLPCLNRVITSHKMLPPGLTMKQYVDEFFYMDEASLVVDPNAYYTGTPKLLDQLNNDNIYRLIYRASRGLTPTGGLGPIKSLKRHGFG